MTSIPLPAGRRCKAYRDLRKLSQEMVSARAEIDVSTVRRLEAGNVVSRTSVEAIARALEITPATLFEKEDLDAFLASRLQDPDELADASEDSSGVEQLRHLDLETFERIKLFPGKFAGHRFQVAFDNESSDSWRRVDTTVALSFQGTALEPGCCVRTSWTDIFDEQSQRIGCSHLYAEGDTAMGLLELKKSTRVIATAKVLFGFTIDPYNSGVGFHDPKVYDEHFGLLIEKFTVVEDSGSR